MEFAQRLLATRRGSTIIGIAAAVLAGILLLVYISQYRNSVKSSNATVQVIVARSLIQKGTPGDVIGTQRTFQSTSIAKDQVREGAFVDAASLRGKVATTDIFPGQQLTSAEFAPASESIITTRLTGQQRAISVPVDGAHGLVGGVQTGDHVDVLASFGGIVREIVHNALVLRGPGASGGVAGTSGTIVLRATAAEVAKFAWASDNGKIWIILRPGANAVNPPALTVSATNVLTGGKK
jgi:Flp pilus assembly protein CpaB